MSLGTLVLGLLNGLTVGLLAVGLVLVYKSNRFLNLAQAQLGTLSALLLAKWVLDSGWDWWAAFGVAVVVGVVTGLLVERLLVAPLRRRSGSPVRLLLLSLAIAQLLLALTFIPALNPSASNLQQYPQPFTSHVQIGGVALSGMWVLTAVLVPILVGGLAVFMRYSVLGQQIRAAANNPEAARLCGISVARVSAVTWGLAGGLSAVAAILQAPTQPSFNVASLGPYLLMLTLGAAAFGAFVSLPATLAGGVILGLVSQVVSAETSNGSDAELAVFVAILLVVLVRGKAISRVFAVAGGVTEALPVTRVPKVLASSALVRHHRMWLAAAVLLLAVVFPNLPWFNSAGHQFLLVLVLIYALVGVGLTMLVGWSGQVSLGQFAVVGLGAYAAARFSAHGWSLLPIMAVAAVIGAGVMVLVGLPALRVGGLTLAVTTLGFAVVAADWLYLQGWAGSSQPFAFISPIRLFPGLGTPSSQLSIYYVALAVLTLGVFAAGMLRRLGPGRLVVAVRDNERAAQAFGISPASVKLAILGVSGLFAGVAGVLWGDAWRVASPDQFTADLSVAVVAIPVIGGLGSIGGAVLAAVLLYAGTFFIGPAVSPLFGSFGHNLGFQLFLAGAGQVAVLLAYPSGVAGVAQARWQAFLDRRAWRMAERGQARSSQADTGPVKSSEGAGPVPEIAIAPAAAKELTAPEWQHSVEVGERDLGGADGLIVPGGTNAGAVVARDGWSTLYRRLSGRRAGWEPNTDGPPLVTTGLRLAFGGVVALDGANVQVNRGEIVGLIGPNGAGKTTLMNVISGAQRPDGGSVRLFGREVAKLPAHFRAALEVSRSFQDATLFAGLSVTETLQVALAYRHRVGMLGSLVGAPWVRATERRTRAEAGQVARRFGLEPWAEALTQELSTGTRRVCDLAAQVASRPKLMLLDEPTAGVAQRDAEVFGPLLRRVREELDCAVLIVEHDMPLLMGLCDRVYAMQAGQVIAEGTPEEIRSNPAVIASYLGVEESAISRSGTVPALALDTAKTAGVGTDLKSTETNQHTQEQSATDLQREGSS